MRFFLFLAVILTASSLFAQEQKIWNEGSTLKIAERYQENGIFKIDLYEIKKGRLQERVESKTYNNKMLWNVGWARFADRPRPMESLSFLSSPASTETDEVLWTPKNHWNKDWEKRYYDWVDKHFDEEFFAQYGIATDCADAAIALRWIFARDNSLPVGNRLAGSGVLFSQASMKSSWLRLPTAKEWHKDQRFRRALDYVTDNTYTHSLLKDSYPITLSRESLRAGSFLLELDDGDSGHTRVIAKTSYENPEQFPILMMASTTPKTVRSLQTEAFISIGQPTQKSGGLRHMLWVVPDGDSWQMQGVKDALYFSEEQYSDFFKKGDFAQKVYKHMGIDFQPMVIAERFVKDLVTMVESRIDVVNQGFEFCQSHDCQPGTKNWEGWSTPSRDKRLIKKFETFSNIIGSLGDMDVYEWVQKELTLDRWNIDSHSFSLEKVENLFQLHFHSSDPRVSPLRRWALGTQAIAENMVARVQRLIEKREEMVPGEGAACEQGCEFGSPEFARKTTAELDLEIRSYLEADVSYCMSFEDSCELFRQSLNEMSVEVNGQTFPLLEFLEKNPFLSSDPNHDWSQRWAKQELPVHVLLKNEEFPRFFRDYMVRKNSEKAFLFKLSDHSPVEGPDLKKIKIHRPSSNFPFWGQTEGGDLYAFSIEKEAWQKISNLKTVGIFSLLGRDHFAIITDPFKLQVFRFDPDTLVTELVVEDESPFYVNDSATKPIFLINKNGEQRMITHHGEDFVNVPLEKAFPVSYMIFNSVSEDYLATSRVTGFEDPLQTRLIEIKTGKVHEIASDLGVVSNVFFYDVENQLIGLNLFNDPDDLSSEEVTAIQSVTDGNFHLGPSLFYDGAFVHPFLNEGRLEHLLVYDFSGPLRNKLLKLESGQLKEVKGPEGSFVLDVNQEFAIWVQPNIPKFFLSRISDRELWGLEGPAYLQGKHLRIFSGRSLKYQFAFHLDKYVTGSREIEFVYRSEGIEENDPEAGTSERNSENLPVAEILDAELEGFDLEDLDRGEVFSLNWHTYLWIDR